MPGTLSPSQAPLVVSVQKITVHLKIGEINRDMKILFATDNLLEVPYDAPVDVYLDNLALHRALLEHGEALYAYIKVYTG